MQEQRRIGMKETVVFPGACIRESDQLDPPRGSGYVRRFRDLVVTHAPELMVEVVDRTVEDPGLEQMWERWHDDVLSQGPDWVVLLAGIGDAYRHVQANDRGDEPLVRFTQSYRRLLQTTKERLPTARIVLLEPYLASLKRSAHTTEGKVLPVLERYAVAVESLAREFDLPFVPCHKLIQSLKERDGDELFGPSSLHLDQQGSVLIAETLAEQIAPRPQHLMRSSASSPASESAPRGETPKPRDGDTILFIGDSITDCGRRALHGPLGVGYVRLFAELHFVRKPDTTLNIINKGIGGNTILDLDYRWERDAIAHAPDWLVVKIGINDVSHYVCNKQPVVTPDLFERHYRKVLDRTREALPECRILLLTPFYMSTDHCADSHRGRMGASVVDYARIVKNLGEDYDAKLVDMHSIFANHLQCRHNSAFGREPIHPNETGAMILAEAVYEALCA